MTDDTLLLRQIHPSFLHNGVASSQAFRPTPKDESKLSAYDGDQITAQMSWEHYTSQLTLESAGVMAITVGECKQLALNAIADPAPFKEHCLIDFSEHSESEIKKKSKSLKASAGKRNWLYQP